MKRDVHEVTAMLDYYTAGHSQTECADKFGMTKAQVEYYRKKHGVSGGMSKAESLKRLQEHNGGAKGNAEQNRRAGERIRKRVFQHGFKMIGDWRGGRNSHRDRYSVKCLRCGYVFELQASTMKQCKFKCPECEKRECESIKQANAMREFISFIATNARQACDALDRQTEHAIADMQTYAPQLATCRHCGKQWTFWPSREKYGRKNPPPYCSKRCRVKHNKTPSNIGHRLRANNNGGAPRDKIPLRELYERDGGICQICGEPTDWNDYTRDAAGRFWYINGKYPTCDHIVPIAKGGLHVWDNVQLACRDCNSAKGATLDDEMCYKVVTQ